MASKLKNGTTNACNIGVLYGSCEVNEILRNISPRWKMQVLHSIKHGIRQFSLLKEAFPSLSDQILGKRLSELVIDGLVDKAAVEGTVPQQIVYTTTKKGEELLKVIDDLHQWGMRW
ncbi:DNA-binding HxlR family transcriptional regulator [Pedobacter cryoconitis]|uniref:DNA-binding HxlR family transcriptional regulator n=1 Tax=Pedobacter cryoconitis TaxID=188932 RepID=A0A7W8ZN60_9SPHI|nr:helix-turn-helix domain-containing protein [Pedobacter cryoconitis]MBB5637099.1 DNA-binding HxlR family transcriptional regulator [Pedobacter cryoconitis]